MDTYDPVMLADIRQNYDFESDNIAPGGCTKEAVVKHHTVLLDRRNFEQSATIRKAVKAGLLVKWGTVKGVAYYALTEKGWDTLFVDINDIHGEVADGWNWPAPNTGGPFRKIV